MFARARRAAYLINCRRASLRSSSVAVESSLLCRLNSLPDFCARNISRITQTPLSARTFRHNMSTTTAEPARVAVETFRKDYTPVPHTIDTVALKFVLNDDQTEVTSTMKLKPLQPLDASGQRRSLRLNGRSDVRLVSIAINSVLLPADAYVLTSDSLTLLPSTLPETDSWELTIVTAIKPHENTLLEGLYHSSGAFCTQCEAEGFRGITFFLDRPDVMSTYSVRIEGDATKLPVMLSNGNLTGQGALPDGRHFTEWTDPFRKPCYLFALVAGDLAMSSDTFVTASGRKVDLRIFVEHCNIDKVAFAMQSLKRSMKWDEDTFGLEYDLDLFNIVAVSDFNMGAMENKSLNIFNSRLILATPNTASDMDFNRIESVVGHEYFHNWTGDRVTCRDWFQLTLKEGLTVYRDQEFTSDLNSRPVKRIEDVVRLRASQFAEDGGPMAHPIRPDSYIKMDNFYTLTVYEKGAEVIRMYEAILGKAGFRKGMDLYFKRHDGQAVTCDDFRAAMADANGEDLTALGLWYGQAGTPRLQVEQVHNAQQGTFTLRFKQHTPPSAGQPTKVPVLIPVRMALLGADGALLPLRLNGRDVGTETVLRVTQAEQEFVFEGVGAFKPTPSLLRDYSAPVLMTIEGQTDADLLFILEHDTDAFNRYEAGQVLAKKLLLSLYKHAHASASSGQTLAEKLHAAGGVSSDLVGAFRTLLKDSKVDGAFKAFAISLPTDSELLVSLPEADPLLLYGVRTFVLEQIAIALQDEFRAAVAANDDAASTPYEFTAPACARRALKNKALGYLATLCDAGVTADLTSRVASAANMTDEFAAVAALDLAASSSAHTEVQLRARQQALDAFATKWASNSLVMFKWLTVQATSNTAGNVAALRQLMSDTSKFTITNPNSCYSLLLAFGRSAVNFHAADGSGYAFMGDAVLEVDKVNHQVASRLVSAFTTWRNFDSSRQQLMRAQLQRIVDTPGLSENVFEIASKSLQ